jgi:transposase
VLEFFARQPMCIVAMEPCSRAHYGAREIGKFGHTVRLISAPICEPFVKRQKNDEADAEAICEAAQRPTMRFVAVKSEEQQANAVVFRSRDLFVRQRTQMINALRGHLAEYGRIVAQGPSHVARLIEQVEDPKSDLPEAARVTIDLLIETLRALDDRIRKLDVEIAHRAKKDEEARRLMTIPGIGPITATALVALAPDAATFGKGRDFAAWVGLTPLQKSTGGKPRIGKTSMMGERTLRRLLILGASAVVQHAEKRGAPKGHG